MDANKPAPPAKEQGDEKAPETADTEGGSLENLANSGDSSVTDATATNGTGTTAPVAVKQSGFKQKLKQFNIYLLLFVFVLVIAGGIIVVGYLQNEKSGTANTLKTQTLTQNTLNQVASSDATVGNSQEVLNVDSSAVFAGQVLVRNDLQVAGSLIIGGTVALTNLSVGGSTSVAQLSVSKDLALTGNASIQGAVTIAQSLQVNGAGTFSGALSAPQITTQSLQLDGDLILTHHITAGGATPAHTAGPAVGGGGSATVGGSDTSGSLTINTGNSPLAGCFITVTFNQSFNSTPHVLVTPIGAAAAGLEYYVNRTTTDFSVCDATDPPSGSSFAFDYFVVD